MIAQELEVSLHMAFVEARQKQHEFITVEHLLLAMLDNPSAAEVLRACAVNIEDLRKTLTNFIGDNTPTVLSTAMTLVLPSATAKRPLATSAALAHTCQPAEQRSAALHPAPTALRLPPPSSC